MRKILEDSKSEFYGKCVSLQSCNQKERNMILITNDDGISANGIKMLTSVAKEYDDVIVFAPDGARSGMSSAITCGRPLRYSHIGKSGNVDFYSCSGTPVDCVKLALQTVFKDAEKPLVLSGINHGSNASINIIYSGTMGAALEANIVGIPSIGFSLDDWDEDADLTVAGDVVRMVLDKYFRGDFDDYYTAAHADVPVCLNVNIPKGECNGLMVCHQARARWREEFEKRVNENGEEEYWLVGEFVNLDKGKDGNDLYAIENHLASIVPVTSDMTLRVCHKRMKKK